MGFNAPTNTYDTFTDLRLAIGQSSSSVSVIGKLTITDQGGGQFYWNDTSTDNDDDQNIIKPIVNGSNPGRWIRFDSKNLQEVTDFGNTTTNEITAYRYVANGIDTRPGINPAAFIAERTMSPAVDTDATGFRDFTIFGRTGRGYCSFDALPTIQTGSHFTAFQSRPFIQGNVGDVEGYWSWIILQAGTVNNYRNFIAGSGDITPGTTVNNSYGLIIEANRPGINKYAIVSYDPTAKSFHAGTLRIGDTTTATDTLEVVGNGSFTGTVSGANAQNNNDFITKGQLQTIVSYITPQMFGAKGDGATDDTIAFQAAVDYLYNQSGSLYIPKGIYIINNDIRFNPTGEFKEGTISVFSDQFPILKKGTDFPTDGHILQFRETSYVNIEGITFEGKTPTQIANFGDSGLGFFSVNHIRVNNCNFKYLGDGVLKVSSTSINNTITAVESNKIIVTRNFFDTCFQTSTTEGGSTEYVMSENIFYQSKIKFASRYNVADRIIITSNTISDVNNSGNPIEISGYSNLILANNIIKNCQLTAVNIYTNTNAKDNLLTNNITILGNHILNCPGAIRVDNSELPISGTLPTGLKNLFYNLNISNNIFNGITTNASINIINGSFQNLKIDGNIIDNDSNYGISIGIKGDTSLNNEDLITISNNKISVPTFFSIRISRTSGSDRLLSSIKIKNNELIGSLYLENIKNLSFEVNSLYLSGITNSNLVNLLTDFTIRNNIFQLDNANGFNFTNCTNIIFNENSIKGTQSTYSLRYDSTSTGTIQEKNNDIIGTILRNTPVTILTQGTGSPETIISAAPGSIYQRTDGGIFFKNTGNGNTGWSSPLSAGGNSLGGPYVIGTNDANNVFIRTNGVNRVTLDQSGNVLMSGVIGNNTTIVNGYWQFATSGIKGFRSVADANPVVDIDNNNASNTGNIINFRKAGSLVSSITNTGFFDSPSVTSTIDFGSVAANSELAAPSTITLTGATVGDMVIIGAPNTPGILYKGVVTATDTITIYACNFTTSPIDPTSGQFKVSIIK